MTQSVQNFNSGQIAASTTLTVPITLGSGGSRKIVVAVNQETTATGITALTFDGTSFVANLIADWRTAANTGVGRVRMYYYDVPDIKATGSYNVVLTVGASSSLFVMTVWQSVNSATGAPEDTEVADSSVGTTVPINLTVTADAIVYSVMVSTSGNGSVGFSGSDITLRTNADAGAWVWAVGDKVQDTGGTKTITGTNTDSDVAKVIAGASFAGTPGPTITVQPTAQTKVLTNANTATFSVTATGTGTVDILSEIESGVGSGVYGTLAAGSGATWTGLTGTGSASASTSLVGTFTAKTLSGRKVRFKADDDNGTSYSNEVLLTLFDGPVVTTFPATNGSGVSTATLTCDYVTGVGEAIDVRIPLSDGDVAVTVTTT